MLSTNQPFETFFLFCSGSINLLFFIVSCNSNGFMFSTADIEGVWEYSMISYFSVHSHATFIICHRGTANASSTASPVQETERALSRQQNRMCCIVSCCVCRTTDRWDFSLDSQSMSNVSRCRWRIYSRRLPKVIAVHYCSDNLVSSSAERRTALVDDERNRLVLIAQVWRSESASNTTIDSKCDVKHTTNYVRSRSTKYWRNTIKCSERRFAK